MKVVMLDGKIVTERKRNKNECSLRMELLEEWLPGCGENLLHS
jgi:hypothetical protein